MICAQAAIAQEQQEQEDGDGVTTEIMSENEATMINEKVFSGSKSPISVSSGWLQEMQIKCNGYGTKLASKPTNLYRHVCDTLLNYT